jgi:hypothetical protein
MDQEIEPPIEALAGFLEEPPEDLPARVRGSINRRLLAADAVDLSFNQILQVFLELVKIIFEGLRSGESGKGGQG